MKIQLLGNQMPPQETLGQPMASHGSLVAPKGYLCTLGGLLDAHKLIFTNGKRVENP